MEWERQLRNHEYDCLGAVVLDANAKIRAISDRIVRLSGYSKEVLLTMDATDLLHPDDLARGVEVLSEVKVTPGTRADGMYRLRFSDGTYDSFALRAINLGADFENAIVFRVSTVDERTRVAAEAFAEDAVDATRMLCEERSLDDWFDWATKISDRHISGLRLFGTVLNSGGPNDIYSRHEIPADIHAANQAASPDSLPPHVQAALDEHRRGPWLAPDRVATRDGVRPERLTSVLLAMSGAIAGYIEVLRPTTAAPPEVEWLLHAMITRIITAAMQRLALDYQLRWAAGHDPLTGLVNRRKLMEAMGEGNLQGSQLFLIDLDHFSTINNTLGHQAGDEALVSVGAALVDAAPEGSVVARMGGDEFLAWIPAVHVEDTVANAGQRLRESMGFQPDPNVERTAISSSVGAVTMLDDESPAQAIARADAAMYKSKRSGGGAVSTD